MHESVADRIVLGLKAHFERQTWLDQYDAGLPSGHLRKYFFAGIAVVALALEIKMELDKAYEQGRKDGMNGNNR